MVRILAILLFFVLVAPLSSSAQTAGVSCSFVVDTVITSYGQTFTNKLKLENRTSQKVLLSKGDISEENLLQLPDTLVLTAGAARTIPVKFFAAASLFGPRSIGSITASYTNTQNNAEVKATFIVKLDQSTNVVIGANESLVYINPASTFTPIRVRCYNKGYTQAVVNIKLTINPFGLIVNNPVRQVVLKAGEERMIDMEVALADREKSGLEYNALIEATNDKGMQLSSIMVHLTVLQSNNRENPMALQYANSLRNAFEVSYVNLNNAFTYYQTRVNGNIALSRNTTINYLGNFNYYDHLQKYESYDSWVGINTKRFSLKVGSIMENLDHPVYGRGVKSSIGLSNHSNLSLYYVQNSYTLFSTVNNFSSKGGMMAASYDYERNGYLHRTSLLTGTDQLTGAQMSMVNSYTLLPIGARQRLELKAGYSNEARNGSGKNGVSGGANYSYRGQKLNINLNNYYSSPYYSGLQRGSVLMDNQLSYNVGRKTSIFGHFALLNNRPKYLADSLNSVGLYNNTTKYEVGIERRMGQLNISLHPYLLQQNTRQNEQLIGQAQTSSSARMGFDVNYSLKRGSQLFLMSDVGYTRTFNNGDLQKQYMGVKVNGSYMHNWWGINTSFQRSPYYLSEEVLLEQIGRNYYSYAVGPNLRLTTMRQKLTITANPYVSFASYGIGQTRSVNAQATYRLKGNWQLTGDVFYTNINGATSNLRSRMGISKQFNRTSIPGSKNLELTFFNDANNDGVQNKGEETLQGLIVTLRNNNDAEATDITTLSSGKGTVSYSNLKEGNYNVAVMKGNGLHMAENTLIDLQKSKKLAVPMVKSIWLKGKVVPVKQEYATSKPLLEGLRITALNADNKEYSTLTNEDGEFEFSLPASLYHVKVALNGQKYLIRNQDQEVMVNNTLKDKVEFQLVDETRKIVVKQF